MKTLIVDDDFTCRLLLQSILSSYGECHIAVDGAEALRAFRLAHATGQPYDLLCLDIMMPQMDGHGVLRAIRAEEESAGILLGDGVKILMTTGQQDAANVFSAFREMCDGYLIKPVPKAALVRQLQALGLAEAAAPAAVAARA